ncbi:MAG: alpha/beta hydrolase [Hyphomicrobiaceae bacterium]|nr:alpha/beta hydrolase [Hyphomicrobiaceae bacterium]
MAEAPSWSESTVDVSGAKLFIRRAGKGMPVLVLPHDIGTLDKLAFYDALAASHEVIVPDYAGWGRSPRQEWMRNVRDIAVQMLGLLSELGLEKVSLVGLGFGGWVAAEMATMAPRGFARLALVGPMGIKPDEGYILDQAIISYIDYPHAFFHDRKSFEKHYGNVTTDQLEAWDIAREMCFRLAWKPYMYSQTLPHLLGSVKAPSLVVWGEHDQVVPPATASQWKKALPNAKLETVKGSGHAVDMEKPGELASLVGAFLK